jgi:hypothetical protein
MGIQINGQTDIISAVDGSLTISGADLPTVTNLNATGIITAASFSGSGANLTGIAATTDVRTNSLVVSGVSTFAAGSATSPSISFSGSPTTGLYSPGTNQFAIATNGNNGFQVESINATGGVYDNVSFSVAVEETQPSDVQFSTDGSKMFILGNAGDDVTEYTLSTPWDVSSASYVTEFSVVSQDNTPRGMFFRNDGAKLFIVGDQNDTVYQYTLATPWSIATASYDSVSFSVASQDNSPLGVTFKPDGLTMYIVGNQNDAIYQYTLGTAWNVSTATFLHTFSVAAQEATPGEVVFSADGTTMYVLGSAGDDITTYTLSTPWDISTAVYVTEFSVAAQDTSPTGLFIKPDGTKAYVVGQVSDAVYQYTLLPTKVTVNGKLLIGTSTASGNAILQVNGDLAFNSGYGSVATAYGCRAWVNFNGTGTVAIRESGNVSSITDSGTGIYTVNFTTAMPDADYSTVANCGSASSSAGAVYAVVGSDVQITTSSVVVHTRLQSSGGAQSKSDNAVVLVAIFR